MSVQRIREAATLKTQTEQAGTEEKRGRGRESRDLQEAITASHAREGNLLRVRARLDCVEEN